MPVSFIKDTHLAAQSEADRQWLVQTIACSEKSQCDLAPIIDLFALSPYARRVCQQYAEVLDFLVEHHLSMTSNDNPEGFLDDIRTTIAPRVAGLTNEVETMRHLRIIRHSFAAVIIYRDFILKQPIQDSLEQVSELADSLITAAYDWQYQQLTERYGTPQGAHGPQPMCILAMGKLGGRELNFSSDIDLIFAYPAKGETSGGRKVVENQQFFTRLAQKLIHLLDTVTADGFVYRVDMRLRPFGESGPLVANFSALEDYYQEQGRDWERYAMLKARVLNSASTYTEQLQKMLKPFVYRRYVDFTALESLRTMKQLIETEVRRKRLKNNIKLGAGGIREVEFFVQSMQVIHAGKHPLLQTASLIQAFNGLVNTELLDSETANSLMSDYYRLRKVEHCIQQIDDQQTQQLPDDAINQDRLCHLMACPDWNSLLDIVHRSLERVHAYFADLIAAPEQEIDQADPLYTLAEDMWTLSLDSDEWQSMVANHISCVDFDLLYIDISQLKQRIAKQPIGQRGHRTLSRLLPAILFDLLNFNNPQLRLAHIAPTLISITGRTAYLDLLLENHQARTQLLELTAKSDWIAEQIARFPLLLDELLDPVYLTTQLTDIEAIRVDLKGQLQQSLLRIEPTDLEALMNAWRQFKLCQQLIIGAADLCDTLATNFVSDHLTALAEVILDSAICAAWRDISVRFGEPQGKTIADSGLLVVAYGKFGGLELGYGSDLDLVFLHDADRNTMTNGEKSVSASQFYAKVVQRVMHMLSTPMQLGKAYDIDLRLRPDGNSGLLCSNIVSFADYQANNAWTWEHQALVRARPVWGQMELQKRFNSIRHEVLAIPRDLASLRRDVVDMRVKMRQHLLKQAPDAVDLKQAEGGITDIEFLVQYWVLGYANTHAGLTQWPDNLRILDALATTALVTETDVMKLQNAYLSMRQAIHEGNLQNLALVADTEQLHQLRQYVKQVFSQHLEL
ncbi:bifunctional [glutamate--ammonia ligase]-adenylyl-L-tyrosine phosphorylase/[glutamate--ammonia-ligase] adenylyltransferase [Alteromonas sp. ASW11-36]|uniref:Bifunctional glutamine synthetase adenylyltransferase/adenylyl-removing enzyme n=1 Tax=Alteromonas arenosi TaxID=3055817 RepID=A0ABT7STU5_9ALTE|nr:bifunctional [glutamate--ammonia ligase]-adenylyl-L-tyrosine phosphorylase/[glutamate--ammonia-ligase] adenylyltransferase [Alteromonas sp. ASW11-36]MDM7859613.1 bifunctional [glutamate--ammonia ligase]-adenylyl-L-tyrosine phosphorylase/[glutamate--ammonia-ligase] adenylyltransferase [Alteromonas sp. ASW11-36]